VPGWLKLAFILGFGAIPFMSVPAHADAIGKQNWEQFNIIRGGERQLLESETLPNSKTQYELDANRKLRPFESGHMVQLIEAAPMTFQPGPFSGDVLLRRDQAVALENWGALSHMTHFAIVNAANPNVKAGAVIMLGELAEVAGHFNLGELQAQYQRLATDVGDPNFNGGPSPLLAKYDATVRALYDLVSNSYGIDGHWYFEYGGTVASMFATAIGGDELSQHYYISVLDDLNHNRPYLKPDRKARRVGSWMAFERPEDTHFLAMQSWDMLEDMWGHNVWHSARPHLDYQVEEDQKSPTDRHLQNRHDHFYNSGYSEFSDPHQ
jgi:hypothetical protein